MAVKILGQLLLDSDHMVHTPQQAAEVAAGDGPGLALGWIPVINNNSYTLQKT